MFHKRLMREFKNNRIMLAGMVMTQWIMLAANIILMFQTASFITALVHQQDIDRKAGSLLTVLGIAILVRAVMSYINGCLSFEVSRQVKEGLRSKVYTKLMALGSHYHDVLVTSEAVQISTEGVEQLEIYFGKYVPQFFYSMLAPLTLFAVMGSMSLTVAVVLLVCVPLIPLSIVAVQKFAKKMLAKYWGTYTELGDSFLECLQALTTLKIYNADARYAEKMDEEAEKFRKVTMRVLIMQLNSISVMDLVAYGGAAVGIILSILEFKSVHITLTECFFIIMISAEFFLPLRQLGSFFHIAMNGNAAADKIFRLLDADEPKQGTVTDFSSADVKVSHVTFAYQPRLDEKEQIDTAQVKNVLEDINFRAGKGFTALVGESGCGKTTLTELILGTLAPKEGDIRIGGVSLAQIDPDALYRKMTRISHNSYLFAGTVRENLRMGSGDAADADMMAALESVHLRDFIEENGGLDLVLKEGASNLSGGQKQRLALARALLHNSDIYIFDEATSNVDAQSEDDIMRVVHTLAAEKTVIVISHRLANICDADNIFLLKHGKVAESGNHQQLMAQKGDYYKLYSSQMALEQYGQEVSENVKE